MQEKSPKCYMPHEYMNRKSSINSSFYKNMFIEDMNNRIVPISLRRDENDTKAIIDCNENDLDLIRNILNSFSRTYGEEYNISRLVKNTIQEISRDISWYGEAIYEICKVSDNDIKIVGLDPTNFVDLKFFYIQMPPRNNKQVLYPKIISNKLLWKISVPQKLQKNYSYKIILSSIDQFDSSMPKSMRDDFYQGNSLSPYDIEEYNKKQFLHVNELTRDWGWDQRKWTSNDTTTEFYNIYKQMKFNYSLSIFREYIVLELNNLFSKLGINATIKIEGLISSEEYKDKLEKYLEGKIDYEEALKILY